MFASGPVTVATLTMPSSIRTRSARPTCHTIAEASSVTPISTPITVIVNADATIAFTDSFKMSPICSGRPAIAACAAERNIIPIVTARPMNPTLAASPFRNHASVTRGVVPVSSTDHTHSINKARPLASQR